jgi:hypothetical protein
MEFERYEQVPPQLAAKVIDAATETQAVTS